MYKSLDTLSLLDPRGALFEKGGRILRAIPEAHAPFFQKLLSSRLLENLTRVGLVGTRVSDVRVEGHPLVLEHAAIEFPSYWREWPSLMLKDAAIMVCDLNEELVRHGLGTQDGHPWNVLPDFGRPVFVDFSSIVPLSDFTGRWAPEWTSLFRRCWLLPLTFLSLGRPGIARGLSKAIDVDESIDRLLAHSTLRWFPWWFSRVRRLSHEEPLRFFREVKDRLAEVRLPMHHTEWSDYFAYTGHGSPDDFEHHDEKARSVRSLLERLRPSTVLDIGGNKGWYSILSERLGAKVVCLDLDEGCINSLYELVRARQLRILPLLMDFSLPTPRHGRKVEFPAAAERLRSDVTLMLALVHHLVFESGLTFERIAQLLDSFTIKYSIVEFVPPEDEFVAQWSHPSFGWYREGNFVKAMEKYFKLETVLNSRPPRKILLFEKR